MEGREVAAVRRPDLGTAKLKPSFLFSLDPGEFELGCKREVWRRGWVERAARDGGGEEEKLTS